MKNLLRKKNILFMFVMLALIFAGCIKKDDYYKKDTDESSRRQVVQIIGAEDIITIARDIKSTNDTFALIDLRRYPNNEAELNQPLTVKLTRNPTLIADYNTTNGTTLIELPTNSYTLLTDLNNVTFQPGEAIVEIKISVKQSLLDLSESYALGFSIADVGANAAINTPLKNALYNIGLKNMYDGKYTLHGDFYHPTQSPNWDPFTVDVEMWTSGTNSVKMYVPDLGGFYHPGLFMGTLNAFGAQEPEYTINPTTNIVTVQNSYVGAVTFYTMFAGYNSRYDPATKTIYAKFGYNLGPGGTFISGTSRAWTDTLIYVGPR